MTIPSQVNLIDAFLPSFDVREHHETQVRASASQTYAALRTTDLASSPVARGLLGLRALPAALWAGSEGLRELRSRQHVPVTLATFERFGFCILAERPPNELLIGLEGRFWQVKGNLHECSADALRSQPIGPGNARAAWNFLLSESADGATTLETETRVQCADSSARLRFLPYWALIRPFSGLLRRMMLHDIRLAAENRNSHT